MTIDQATIEAFKRYKAMIETKGVRPADHSDDPKKSVSLEHALFMCNEMTHPKTTHFSLDKKSRWLGFVQCILITNGLTTVKQERNITRPWFNKKSGKSE